MNQAEILFRETGGAPTQTDALIAHLHAANGSWVALPELVEVAGAYAIHSRAADARRAGINIENKVEFSPITKKRHSFYRLLAP